ncbi:MAG TPA: histidine--tRNA ligase [Chloroflexi bacterium]|nr:histidine--tRNA ligase [Chloroflexota bacterium]
MKNVINSVKGTRDFYPENMAVRTWLYNQVRQVSEMFGYQEYEAPILETLELYAAKSSEELVKKQSYAFLDKGGDEIVLRPELTPSLARMIVQRQRQLSYPLRWWSFGPFWRYEAPQKGRTREFFQWNIDLIGVDTPEADAEMVAIVTALFKSLGLTPDEAVVLVNDRRLTNQELENLGVPAELRQDALGWIDRRDKLSPEKWDEYGAEIGFSPAQIEGTKAFLARTDLWQESESLRRVFAVLEAMGVQDYVRYDPGIIRGLPYYTGIVFEAFDVSGSVRRAILGGGRYNNLMAAVGGDPMPAVGFAMGDLVISLILEELGRVPDNLSDSPAAVLVTIFDEDSALASFNLAANLRQAGLKIAIYPEVAKLAKQFKYADRIGTRLAAVLGPDEIAKGQVTIKNLDSREQSTLPKTEVAEFVKHILAGKKPS